MLQGDIQRSLDQSSLPVEYLLEKTSWSNLGKLLLQVYEDVSSERKSAVPYANIRITITDQGECSEPDIAAPAATPTKDIHVDVIEIDDDDETAAATGRGKAAVGVAGHQEADQSGGRQKKKPKRTSSSVPPLLSDPSAVAVPSDNDTQDSGMATSEVDEPQPMRRKSRRHEERLREEHAAAAKIALEKNLAYRLQAFLPGDGSREQTKSTEKHPEKVASWPPGVLLELVGSKFQVSDGANKRQQELSSFALAGSDAIARETSIGESAYSAGSTKRNAEGATSSDINVVSITRDHVSKFVSRLSSSAHQASGITNLLKSYLDQCGEWAQLKLANGDEEIHSVCFWAEKLINGTLDGTAKHRQGSIELAMVSGHNHCLTGGHALAPRAKLFLLELKFDMLIRNAPHGKQRKKQLKQLSSLIAAAERLLLEFCLMEGSDELQEELDGLTSDMVRLFWVLARMHERSGRAYIAKNYYLKCQESMLMHLPQDKSTNPTAVILPNQKLDSEISLEILEEKISGLQYSDVCSEARSSFAGGNYDQAISLLLGHFFPAKQMPRIVDLLHEFEVMETESESDERRIIEIMMESFTKSSTYGADDALLFLVTLLYHLTTFIDELEENEESGGVLHPEQIVESGLNAIEFILNELEANAAKRVVGENCQSLLQACCLKCLQPSILLLFDSPKDIFQSVCTILVPTEMNEEGNSDAAKQLTTIDAVARTYHMIRSFDEADFRDLFAKLPSPAIKKKYSRRDRVRALLVELLRFLNWYLRSSELVGIAGLPQHKKSVLMRHCCTLMKEEEDIIARREDKTSRQLFGNAAILFLLLCASSLGENAERDRKTLSDLVSLLHNRMGQYGICGLSYFDQLSAALGGSADGACFLETCIWTLSRYTHASERRGTSNGKSSEVQTESEDEEDADEEDAGFDTEMAQCYLCLYDVHILSGCEDHKTGNTFALLQRDTPTKRPNALRLAQFAFPILLSRPPKNNSQKKENLKLLGAIRESLKDTHSLEHVQTRYRPNELQKFLAPSNLLEWDGGPFPGIEDDEDPSEPDESGFHAPLDHLWYLLGENYILPRVRRRGNANDLAEMEQRVKERISFLMSDVLYYRPRRIKSWIRLGKTMKALYHATSDACAVILGRKRKISALLEYTSTLSSESTNSGDSASPKTFTFKDIVLGMSLFDKMKQWDEKEQSEQDAYRVPIAGGLDEVKEESGPSSFSMEAFAIYYIVQVIEFARRCFAMAAHLAEESLEKTVEARKTDASKKVPTKQSDDNDDEEEEEDGEMDELRNTIIECNEECGLLLYNVLQEFSVVKQATAQLFPDATYSRVAQTAFSYFQKGLEICENVEDAEEVRFRLNFMSGKTLKKQRRCEPMKATLRDAMPSVLGAMRAATPREIIECFAKAEKAHEDGEMEHALVHAFYALQAMRMEVVLAHPVNVPDLRLVCEHYFEEEAEEEEESDDEDDGTGTESSESRSSKCATKKKTQEESEEAKDGAPFLKMTKEDVFKLLDRADARDDDDDDGKSTALHAARGWLYLNVIDALESIPNEDRYFHPSRYVLAQGVYRMDDLFHATLSSSQDPQVRALVAALRERQTPPGLSGDALAAERAVKELTPLFDKKRPQVVAIWLSEHVPTSKKFEELNQRQMKYDRYRLKYWQFYMQLLEESGAYGKLKEVGSWVLACKEEHDVIDEMLGLALQARGNVLRARIRRFEVLAPQSTDDAVPQEDESMDGVQDCGTQQALLKLLAKTYTYYLDVVDSHHRLVAVVDDSHELLHNGELLLVYLFLLGATAHPNEFPLPAKGEESEESIVTNDMKAITETIQLAFLRQNEHAAASNAVDVKSTQWKCLLDATRLFCEEKWPERMGKGKLAKSRLRLKQQPAATTTVASATTIAASVIGSPVSTAPIANPTAAANIAIEIESDHEESTS